MADIINPDKTVITHNADVYWHYAGDPVSALNCLAPSPIGAPQRCCSRFQPMPISCSVPFLEAVAGGHSSCGPADATPVTISALGIAALAAVHK